MKRKSEKNKKSIKNLEWAMYRKKENYQNNFLICLPQPYLDIPKVHWNNKLSITQLRVEIVLICVQLGIYETIKIKHGILVG